jgi:hypothetical protein
LSILIEEDKAAKDVAEYGPDWCFQCPHCDDDMAYEDLEMEFVCVGCSYKFQLDLMEIDWH